MLRFNRSHKTKPFQFMANLLIGSFFFAGIAHSSEIASYDIRSRECTSRIVKNAKLSFEKIESALEVKVKFEVNTILGNLKDERIIEVESVLLNRHYWDYERFFQNEEITIRSMGWEGENALLFAEAKNEPIMADIIIDSSLPVFGIKDMDIRFRLRDRFNIDLCLTIKE